MMTRGGRLINLQLVVSAVFLGLALGNAIISWPSAINILTALIASVNMAIVFSILWLHSRKNNL